MHKKFLFKICFYILISLVIVFSFFNHSSLYSPFLNSDDGVVVLMIHDFNLPHDLYFWGANRFGSLIPLAGQFFYKILHFSPIQTEAITHYLLLILGFLGFSGLIKSNIVRLLFAIVWFLPPLRMIDILKVSQGEQYALIGISVYCMNKLYAAPIRNYRFREYSLLSITTLIFIASIWVSDLAIVTIGILLFIFILKYGRHTYTRDYRLIVKQPEFYFIVLGFMSGALFIYYAKANAVKEEIFYSFFDLKMVYGSFRIFASTIIDTFLFRIREPFTSLYTYLLMVSICMLAFNYKKISLTGINTKWAAIFTADIVLIFLVIISSKWAYQNGVPRRYFVCNYVSFWVLFLVLLDNVKTPKIKNFLTLFLLVTVLSGGLGTLYNFKYIFPKSLKPTIETAGELKSLGKMGIISEYWNSYINSAVDPDNIKATPDDKSLIRNQSYVDSVFSQPEIYVIRDSWMNFFPDTLEQFGYTLLKTGDEFRMANSRLCRYSKIKINKSIPLNQLKCNESQIFFDEVLGRDVLKVNQNCNECLKKHIVYGPFIPIGIGKFTARFYMKVTNFTTDNSVAMLDVTAGYGTTHLSEKEIKRTDFSDDRYGYIDLDFETTKRYESIEFRIWYYGNADICFDHVELIEK